MLEKKCRQLIRNTYYAANPRIVFTSKPLLTPGGKYPISNLNKSVLIYQYSCCRKASYIGLKKTAKKRIKEHAPTSVENFYFSDKKDGMPVKDLNVSKRSSIAEHLVNNSTCANSYNLNRFKIVKTCSNVFDLIKLEAICILLRKPVLCKQKKKLAMLFLYFRNTL